MAEYPIFALPIFGTSKNNSNIKKLSHFQYFKEDVSGIALPGKFTFPFYYEPHPLAVLAAREVQAYLENQADFEHDFGLDSKPEDSARGKMFGVLVVKNAQGEVGYLAAFSGNLADKSLPDKFVPPLFDLHRPGSFFREGEDELNAINLQIKKLEENPLFIELQKTVEAKTLSVEAELQEQKEALKLAKKARKLKRKEAEISLSPEAFLTFNESLRQESLKGQFLYKKLTADRREELLPYQQELEVFTDKIAELKAERKSKSGKLQQKLFDQYQFLNQQKTAKGLTEIFPHTEEQKPPAGAGDCSAPKLLQYAFYNELKPLAMAEFWWGISPKTEVRKHQHYYPACYGRCKPILEHMLDGIEMDESPLAQKPESSIRIEIVFEDDALLVINKPPELLSIPGKDVSDSVFTRMKSMFPQATGPLLVHRLDMSTSGILLIAKTKEAHKKIQSQFIRRTIKKRYVALLDGIIEQNEGEIDLPLRVDLDDRPRQLVCHEHGKKAKTKWKKVGQSDGKTKVHLYPITGRTHQLRIHASHPMGLNTPILGDDLYGKRADRLHLHAEFIEFYHPSTREKMSFTVEAEF